ncbi:MAG: type II secretion system minor pseudopilin GspK [Pseudomonadota bacterium]|nr:type II secretion system minor pseudopilin GspK [Pseudomonadota bacterium]
MKRARGVALISALLIVALATVLAAAVGMRASLRLRDAGNAQALSQAVSTARAAIDFGRWALRQDQIQDARASAPIDSLGENWAQSLPAFPVEGGSVSGGVQDAQGLINLNNLGLGHGALDLQLMQTLLARSNIDPALAGALADWVDADDQTSIGGAEDVAYLGMTPARRAANQPLSDVDELLRVRGFTPAMVARLRPFVTALPEHTPVNINTAPAAVIAALFQVGDSDAQALLTVRATAPIIDAADLQKRAPVAIRQRLSATQPGGGAVLASGTGAAAATPTVPQFGSDWSVNSRYFQIDARATYGKVQYGLGALVRRDVNPVGASPVYPIILRERRTLF